MRSIEVEVTTPVLESFRVRQVAGLFDVPLSERVRETFTAELPDLADDWRIGLVVGPSGSGKTTIAREAFGASLVQPCEWPRERAVIDVVGDACGDDVSIRDVTGLFTAVGFSSPPAWVKPYHVLSAGERFRCELARALAPTISRSQAPPGNAMTRGSCLGAPAMGGAGGACNSRAFPGGAWERDSTIVFDEFTSFVDRATARACAAALGRALRGGQIAARFVGVTCHDDIAPWLEPDWVLDMTTGTLDRRRLRREPVRLEVRRASADVWTLFKRHHYLSGDLSWGARCYLALWDDEPAALCAVLPAYRRRGAWRITRLVTRPEFQGLGVGTRLAAAVGEMYVREGSTFHVTASHPALLAHCRGSPRWRLKHVGRPRRRRREAGPGAYHRAFGRATATFEFIGGEG